MREIKFRAYDNFRKRWIHWEELKNRKDINVWISGNHVKQIECVVQFTGLVDKNGVDIYEGDIVKNIDGEKFEVIFLKGCFCLFDLYQETILSFFDLFGEIELLGNIYENSDLLEGAK